MVTSARLTDIATLPREDRLLHIDCHHKNVSFAHGKVAGVIDWESALAGPSHMNLAQI
jgi:Ser/Thr protein kinase RdoA (MazF antagonist)